MNITVTIQSYGEDQFEALQKRLGDRKGVHEVLGRAVDGALCDHFTRRDGEGNSRGWPSQHFWGNRIRNATAFAGATEESATVTIADRAFAAKVHGAHIVPAEAKALAIPLRAQVAGVRPRDGSIPGLFVWKAPSGNVFLAAKDKDGKALRIYWLLVTSANIPADAHALPPDETIGTAMSEAVQDYLAA